MQAYFKRVPANYAALKYGGEQKLLSGVKVLLRYCRDYLVRSKFSYNKIAKILLRGGF